MIRVFLSYASEDRQRVEALYQNLVGAGFQPWMDTHDLIPGEEWEEAIQRGIQSSDCFLACISPRSIVKDGVLGDEIRAALDRWRKRRGNYRLIPVRLEEVKSPESLARLHWYNLFRDDQWPDLAKVIRRRIGPPAWLRMTAAAVLTLVLAGAGVWWYGKRNTGERWPPGPVRVGVTLWRLREAKPADPVGAKILVHRRANPPSRPLEFIPERAAIDRPFRIGDRVRATFETAQPGFLYIVDQEQAEGRATGLPRLIFPTKQIRGGRNEMQAGQLVETPAQEDEPPYWEFSDLNANHTGEELTIIFSEQPILELAPEADARDLGVSWFADRLREWQTPVTKTGESSGAPATPAEIQAGKIGAQGLARGDPLPQTIFSGTPKRGKPFVASFVIKLSK